jgi:hypothetical protein
MTNINTDLSSRNAQKQATLYQQSLTPQKTQAVSKLSSAECFSASRIPRKFHGSIDFKSIGTIFAVIVSYAVYMRKRKSVNSSWSQQNDISQ